MITKAEKIADHHWIALYSTGRYWHTVRNDRDGEAIPFKSREDAITAAKAAWWNHVKDWSPKEMLEGRMT